MLRSFGNKFLPIVIWCLAGSYAFGQNLVLNPSFESVNTLKCSWYISQAEFNAAVFNWTCPTGGSTDIFHTSLATSCFCSTQSTDPSAIGQQNPHTGNAHAAIFAYGNGGCSPYREYLQGQLSTPLTAGQAYEVSMYVSLADQSTIACNNIGVKFSATPVNVSSMCVYSATPDVNYTGAIITDKIGWTKISFCFTPSISGLQYFMIGNFFSDAATATTAAGTGNQNTVRYFVDDVNVSPTTVTAGGAGTNGTLNICPGDGPVNLFDLLGGTPSTGGSWSGPSILTGGSLGTFFPTTSAIGTYTYTISGNGCTGAGSSTAQVTVSLSGASNASITQPANVCVTGAGVQLVAAAGGGTWTSSCGTCISSGGLFNPSVAGAGSHTVTYSIGGACPGTDTKTIVVEAPPTVSAGNNVAICANASTVLTATGATSYTWSPSASLSASSGASVTAMPSGTTTYTVTGTTGACSNQATITVTVNPLPVVQAGPNTAICVNDTTTLTGSGAFTYSWSPGTGLSGTSGASVSAYPQGTTTYTVTGTDANGCSGQGTVTVTINPLPIVNAGNDVTICLNDTTALSATGASTYEWSPNQNLSSATGASISAWPTSTITYSVKGTDGNGCKNTDNVVVTVNPLPALTVSNDTSICANASATLTASGATSYTWTPSATLSSSTGASVVATPSSTTTYTVVGTSLGCSSQINVSVTVETLPVVQASSDLSICVGDTTVLTATGANSYAWSPANGLSATAGASVNAYPQATTTYVVTGTNAAGCSAQDSVIVTVNPLPVVSAGADVAICLNDTATLSAGGAATYVWSPNQAISLTTGATVSVWPQTTLTYSVEGTDNNGCKNTDNVQVTVHALPIVAASPDVSICQNNTTQLSVSGANSYVWSPAQGLSDTTGTTINATPTATTTYTVYGTDNNGCTNSDNVVVTLFNLPTVNLGQDVAVCAGSSAQLTVTGANTYTWSPLTNVVSSNPANSVVTASPTNTITYTVTGTDGNGCTGTDQIVVTVNNNPTPSFTVAPAVGCAPLVTHFTYTGSPVSTYTWTLGNGSQVNMASPVVMYTQPGTYTVGVSVTDQFGCTGSYTLQNAVSVYPYPVAGFGVSPQQVWEDNAFVNVTDGSTNANSWQYFTSDGYGYSVPSFTHQFNDTGLYQIIQIVTSAIGCSDTAMMQVLVKPISTVYIPNAFTPGNTDNLNNTFKVYGNGLDEFELLIFDRWGELLFTSLDQNVGWDGTLRGKLCKQDVYVYKVNYLNHRKEHKTVLGSVTLVR